MPIVVTNAGNAMLKINTLDFQADAGFSLRQGKCDVVGVKEEKPGKLPSALLVQPSESAQICVLYSPTDAGKHTGTLALYSNDPVRPDVMVTLTAGQ